MKAKMRLEGIDTWEVRGMERPKGIIARDHLRSLILNKEIQIECSWPKEYGK